uniref:Beta-defensin-like domain-containing protein n=1 Tax=Anolis carolinensis TaxID=28377 RepID=A0A803T2C9_ANOCA
MKLNYSAFLLIGIPAPIILTSETYLLYSALSCFSVSTGFSQVKSMKKCKQVKGQCYPRKCPKGYKYMGSCMKQYPCCR